MPAVGELRQPVGTAFTIRDPLPWPDVAAIAREGEGSGYAAVFLPETGARDTLATLMGIAGETEELLLGTGVIPMPARTARLAAMAAATVQERSGGRHILGVGTGPSAPGALERLRTYVEEIRETGRRERPRRRPQAPAPGSRPDLDRGARSEGGAPRRRDRRRRDPQLVHAGARRGGPRRDPGRGRRSRPRSRRRHDRRLRPRVLLGTRGRGAAQAAASEYGSYPSYARQFEAMGVESSAEAIVEAVCLRGDPDRARERLEAYRTAGADLPVVYPVLAPGEGREAALAVLGTFSS